MIAKPLLDTMLLMLLGGGIVPLAAQSSPQALIANAARAMGGAAEIFAFLGEKDAAIRLLDRLLEMPAGREASVPLLRVDPAYDRLRGDPRFEQMLQRHGKN